MQDTKAPAVVVTNYQQYINADFLQDAIANELDIQTEVGAVLPAMLHVSIAYIDIVKQPKSQGVYKTILALSIKGVTYRYHLPHDNEHLYLAKKGLDLNQYSTHVARDIHIRLLNQAFEGVVFMRAGKIANDLIENFKIK